MQKLKATSKTLLILGLGTTILASCSNEDDKSNVDPLELYNKVTQLEAAFDEQYGDTFKLPENAKQCTTNITKNSDVFKYMDSRTGYDYTDNSQYAQTAKKLVDSLDNLIYKFKILVLLKL